MRVEEEGGDLRLSFSVLIVASVIFSLNVTFPRITAMIATETKISGLSPS